jgi:hypothetical protein
MQKEQKPQPIKKLETRRTSPQLPDSEIYLPTLLLPSLISLPHAETGRLTMADYKEISNIARKRRATNIAAYYNVPTEDEATLPNNLTDYSLKAGYYITPELEIIQSEAEDILQKIRDRIWTSTEVAQAFCKASAYAQSLTNCVTEVLYAEALERAQYLDEYLEKHGKPIGPLHGLPISLKDCFITAPHPSSIGMAAFANEPLQADTLLVTILRDLGAIFYVKTNVPVAMMMVSSSNQGMTITSNFDFRWRQTTMFGGNVGTLCTRDSAQVARVVAKARSSHSKPHHLASVPISEAAFEFQLAGVISTA